MFFSWDELTVITGGEWRGRMPEGSQGVSNVTDDSRGNLKEALFVALKGNLTDGHRFVKTALENGAEAVCVQSEKRDAIPEKVPALLVDDTFRAYHAIAASHRRRFARTPVVAVTGSCGKTSTRAILAAMCRSKWGADVLESKKNTNNFFGVPRNLFRLGPNHKVALVEIGTNHPGEVRRLARMTGADVGIVTSIGKAHLEFFGDVKAVARAKG